ncbi:preprotein translocase subunit SecE [Candidatus Nomurabacteria bacterium]|uniref:Preprotein translocase subunit SecE n=1 Tax=Candidatus Dojkabacteria bacterium TaxID=2099670 RepID=A0A955I216_9BACT|nr:preprotein translocase subunit SecE [Candidatus Dojkabacteria bacterium]MCB9789744.1 preprotein translocase subunit SecE [Candidatus Nomurabacteria bacterium]MCB9803841.1 preprotein translocase subunit SecE [Candidatus Nomurabacteria bacterium]
MRNPFPGIIQEIRAVTWPTRSELITLLTFTIVVCAILALMMLGLDVFFLELRDVLLNL